MFSFLSVSVGTALVAIAAGFMPAIIWLVFWLFEDRRRPEPRHMVVRTFLVGMLAVAVVLPLEKLAVDAGFGPGLPLFFIWAAIEEMTKLGLALFFVLRNSAVD